ncbi:MAG: nucleotidyltransferase family protein [bacterium]|nr:nucleotidyltransferase family protein [bacterium]
MSIEQRYLLRLIKAAATEEAPPALPPKLNLQALFTLAEKIRSTTYCTSRLSSLAYTTTQNPIMHTMKQRYGRAVQRDIMQDTELAEIAEYFASEQIPYIPMKGSTVKKYYPKHDLCRSGDIDILIHQKDLDKSDKVLTELGYICDRRGCDVHDVYER